MPGIMQTIASTKSAKFPAASTPLVYM